MKIAIFITVTAIIVPNFAFAKVTDAGKQKKECTSYRKQMKTLSAQVDKISDTVGKKFQRELETDKALRKRWLAMTHSKQNKYINELAEKSLGDIVPEMMELQEKLNKCDSEGGQDE